MTAALTRRRLLLASAALLAGAVLLFYLRHSPETPASARAGRPDGVRRNDSPLSGKRPAAAPAVRLSDAKAMSTADIALTLAAWPEGTDRTALPQWAGLLAARGPAAIDDISSALATAETNTARGVLADALARIGTDTAIQEICTHAVKVPEGAPREAIASAFRTLGRPAAVPMLATLLAESDDTTLTTEAGNAIRRLADRAGVESLADLSQESRQLHSQRDAIFRILATLENPEALPALETLAADGTDPVRADAAREGIIYLKKRMKNND